MASGASAGTRRSPRHSRKTSARLRTPVHYEKHVARHKAVAPTIADPVVTEIIMIDVAKHDAVAAPGPASFVVGVIRGASRRH
jgi:hypothetical protein